MPRHAPPPGRQQLGSPLGRHKAQVLRVPPVPEFALLPVSASENMVAESMKDKDRRCPESTELDRVPGEISGLEAVHKRNPDEIADGEHIPKPVGGDVHGGEDGGFVVQGIGDVQALEDEDEEHRVGYV